jgi:hypothetical protein
VLFSLVAYRPFQLYFFGDTWDILCEFHEQGWRTMWRMHNEHFMPLSKALLYIQYALFGMNNFPYQAVNIAIHAMNAALVYVAAGEVTPFVVPRIFGALFFAFSGVYWELTMWEAGQQTTLALLFILLSLVLCARYLRRAEPLLLAATMLTALLASWSMGFGLLVVPLLVAQAAASRPRRWKRAAAICLLPAVMVLSGFAVLLWSDPDGLELARSRATLAQALQVVPWTVTALRGLAASYATPRYAPLALPGVFVLAGLFFRRRFFSKARMLTLLAPLSMLLLPYAITAVGRVQDGIGFAASSRYQYLPAAALGLILAWLAGGVFDIAQNGYPNALAPLALVTLLTLPFDSAAGYAYVQVHSPMPEWGRSARRFVRLAVYRTDWDPPPAGMVCVRPELHLPAAMYPRPFFDLSRALPLYAGKGVRGDACGARIASVFDRKEITRLNLLNGGARGIQPGKWSGGHATTVSFDAPAGGAPQAARIAFRGAGAYGFEMHCADAAHPYSFAASARLASGEPGARMRIVFKNASGGVLETFPSQPIAPGGFSTMVVSAYPPPETATVAVDFAGSAPGSESSVIVVRDAVLLEHPVYLPMAR